ncbi:MAG: hypothetical protein IPF92_30630 [Myxococcales bacterium]|jgi:hypothetical protein|nr:hypothetical protein [Myxococcales bacterium]MBL0195656.1 hypothetical protein [Myxococcales bacterium]HQY61683.1 hypothetical protein [Polyangiaceae bacterium]
MRSLLLVSIALLFAAPALADEPPTAPVSRGAARSRPAEAPAEPAAEAPAEPPASTWYGYQTLLADAASVGLLFASAGAESGGLAVTALVGMGAASPTIHLVHGRPWAAGGSLLVRGAAVTVGGLLGFTAASGCGGSGSLGCLYGGLPEAVTGGLIGYAAASLIDAAVLAHEPSATPAPATAGIRSVAPSVDPRSGAAGVVVGGAF